MAARKHTAARVPHACPSWVTPQLPAAAMWPPPQQEPDGCVVLTTPLYNSREHHMLRYAGSDSDSDSEDSGSEEDEGDDEVIEVGEC